MNSKDDVNIVIVISLHRAQAMIQIEKWELGPGRIRTRSQQLVPTKTQEIIISTNHVDGANKLPQLVQGSHS